MTVFDIRPEKRLSRMDAPAAVRDGIHVVFD
jgi:hypothetical protein